MRKAVGHIYIIFEDGSDMEVASPGAVYVTQLNCDSDRDEHGKNRGKDRQQWTDHRIQWTTDKKPTSPS